MNSPTSIVVTQKTLDLYDKYDKDFGLLDEPWADNKDRASISDEESQILGQFVDSLHSLKVECLSKELRARYEQIIEELEPCIEEKVVRILKERIGVNE